MKLTRSIYSVSVLVYSLVAVAGCSGTSDLVDDGKAVSSLDITPDKDTLSKGSMLQFAATVLYADGTSKDVTSVSDTTWNTSDAELATVSGGMVTAISEGLVDISAEYKGEKADEHFLITP